MKLFVALLIPTIFFLLIVVAMLYELAEAMNEVLKALFGG